MPGAPAYPIEREARPNAGLRFFGPETARVRIAAVSDFKGIPIVPAAEPKPRSGDKYRTPQGYSAIKDGIKATATAMPLTVGRKPQWLRAPMPAGKAFDAVRATVREHRLATVCEEA